MRVINENYFSGLVVAIHDVKHENTLSYILHWSDSLLSAFLFSRSIVSIRAPYCSIIHESRPTNFLPNICNGNTEMVLIVFLYRNCIPSLVVGKESGVSPKNPEISRPYSSNSLLLPKIPFEYCNTFSAVFAFRCFRCFSFQLLKLQPS